jgi:hypothetical protein
MVYYHTRSWLGENGFNKINGIAQKNKKAQFYYNEAISYFENQEDNERLCMLEGMKDGGWWR